MRHNYYLRSTYTNEEGLLYLARTNKWRGLYRGETRQLSYCVEYKQLKILRTL